MTAKLHLAENAFALKLLLQGAKRLIDVVVPDKNLHALLSPKLAMSEIQRRAQVLRLSREAGP